MVDWSGSGGNGGGAVGLSAITAIFQNGVQQLASIAKSLTSLATAGGVTAKEATAAPGSNGPVGYFEVTKADGTTVLIPYYAQG